MGMLRTLWLQRRSPVGRWRARGAGWLSTMTRGRGEGTRAIRLMRRGRRLRRASLREVLGSTTGIVDALQDELRARRAALDALAAEAQDAETRADRARALARIGES